jgi:hypothetical protein
VSQRLPYRHSPEVRERRQAKGTFLGLEQPEPDEAWTIHIQLRATAEEVAAATRAHGVLPLEEGREELRPLEDE